MSIQKFMVILITCLIIIIMGFLFYEVHIFSNYIEKNGVEKTLDRIWEGENK